MSEKVEYFVVNPSIKTFGGIKVTKETNFDTYNDDKTVHQTMKDLVLVTEITRESEYKGIKVKEESKNVNSKLTTSEIANKATADSLIMMAISLIALVVVAVMFMIIGSYMMFWTAIEIIVCAITLFVTSAFLTSGCYSFLKK